MSIRWDTLLTRHTASELDRSLEGARLRAIRLDRERRDVALLFRDRTLLWHLHPSRGYLRLHGPVEPTAEDHRWKGTLQRVEAPPDERLIRFDFSAPRSGGVSLVVELMGNQWNAFVTEGDGDVVRHVLWRRAREALPIIGQAYRPPRPTGRAGADGDVSLDSWLAALEPLALDERRRGLIERFAWTSPLNAPAFLGDGAGQAGDPGLAVGFERWKALTDPAYPPAPVVLELQSGPQPYPYPLPGTPSRPVDTLVDAFEACLADGDEGSAVSPSAVLGPELLTRLSNLSRRTAGRARKLEAELAGLADPQELRRIGDLILARYHDIPSGAVVARLSGFDGEPVEVRLDPAEPAHANASRYYREATKTERAELRLPALLDEARAESARLEDLLERVRAGSADETEVRDVLGPAPRGGVGAARGPSLPYRTFRSSGGLEIRVGRGARYNDDLTFRHSSPGDAWLHARQTAGAHVILRWPGPGNPPARDLLEAATLAALHSKARTSGSVPVDWTLRKYVRKPRKAPPGQVVVEREETLFVEPDAALLESLADRGRPG